MVINRSGRGWRPQIGSQLPPRNHTFRRALNGNRDLGGQSAPALKDARNVLLRNAGFGSQLALRPSNSYRGF